MAEGQGDGPSPDVVREKYLGSVGVSPFPVCQIECEASLQSIGQEGS